MTFVIVGGGPTGVELAGALAEIGRDTLRRDFRSIRPENAQILLVELNPVVLMAYPADRSASARRQLERLGVTVMTDTKVVDVEERAVTIEAKGARDRLPTRTVLWAAVCRLPASLGLSRAQAAPKPTGAAASSSART